MRKALLLTLVLVASLLVFNGCGMVNNPMEVEDTNNSSIEMTKSSIDGTFTITMEVINENSNGNLVFRFEHPGVNLVITGMEFNDIAPNFVSYNCIEPRSVTQIIVDPSNVEPNETGSKFELSMIINGYQIVLISTAPDTHVPWAGDYWPTRQSFTFLETITTLGTSISLTSSTMDNVSLQAPNQQPAWPSTYWSTSEGSL